ncbi:CopG family transcriptional regulator [Candidatus Woesearchaeota archaeon]|nr:CopG family transcriptional regulator [Candidatus Woesearchaeota archaeon]|tara:strand:+ start:642 stop:833 length:192 start_codon:yes stop_codon:yes gene_type:complete
MVAKYVNVGLPIEMIKNIDRVVKSRKFGYKSRSEFVKEAVRRSLEKYMDIKVMGKHDHLINVG